VVLARNESRLAAEVGGTVVEWRAEVGASVRKGEVLARIDTRDLDLALQRAAAAREAAQARLRLGQSQLQRARELVAQGFFSTEALTQRETEVALQQADLASAQAQWQTAQRQLEKAILRAPFDGSVVQRLAQQGEAVAPGQALYVLTQREGAEIQATVDPTQVTGLRQAAAPVFAPQTQEGPAVSVRLLRISPTLQTGSRSQTVRLAPVQPAQMPIAGSAGVLQWQDPQPHVPATLLVRRGNALGLFVDQGGLARFVPLPLAQEGRPSAVSLPADTRVVVQGQVRLQDGQSLN
jgi:RND family efflux transporter MFP subunit